MELILVRHSITQGNLEGRFIGVTDQDLAQEGIELARQRAKVIDLVERIYVSPLHRCRQTAEILWPGVEQVVVPQLRETDFGRLEGKTHEELCGDPDYAAWIQSGGNWTMPTVEPLAFCKKRAVEALKIIAKQCEGEKLDKVGVVTHSGTLLSMLSQLAQPPMGYDRLRAPNCGGWRAQLQVQPLALVVTEALGAL